MAAELSPFLCSNHVFAAVFVFEVARTLSLSRNIAVEL